MISNEEMNDIMKKVKSLEQSGLLIKALAKQLKMKQKKKTKKRFLVILLGILDASLLENLLSGKNPIRASEVTTRAGKRKIRVGQDF